MILSIEKMLIIKYIEENYTSFNALSFCRVYKYEQLQKAKTDFSDAVKEIADRSLKPKDANKELIKWARALRKSNTNLFSSRHIHAHFYSIRRRILLRAKMLLRVQEEESFIDDQLEALDRNQTDDEETSQEVEEENEEISQAVQKVGETTQEARGKEVCNEVVYQHIQYEEIIDNAQHQDLECKDIDIEAMKDLKLKFEKNFTAMKKEDKWYLSSGKCVENELYAFGMQCVEEHPCHSFIIDVKDRNLKKYGVFTDMELKEIESFNRKVLPSMPVVLRDYLNNFNKTTAADLRREIFKSRDFDGNYDRELSNDFDWIRYSVYSLLREYEANKLSKSHKEAWYMSHVWQFIDTVFDGEENIDVLRGECSSGSSSKRKNKDRSIGGVQVWETKKMGYRCDMIFCRNRCGHDEIIEYGATEAGNLYDGDEATKRFKEGFIKLPKCLKDMLDSLLLKKDDRSNMQTIGFIHSGLESFFMRADRPVRYTTRITKSKNVHISNDISGFGSTVLPALYSAWIAKEVVKKVQDVLFAPDTCNNVEDSSWLDSYWNKKESGAIEPETSTSSDIRAKKKVKSSSSL